MTEHEHTPQWVKDRLEAEEEMGGQFENPYERVGYLIGTVLALACKLFWWVLAFAAVACVLYLVGRALVG